MANALLSPSLRIILSGGKGLWGLRVDSAKRLLPWRRKLISALMGSSGNRPLLPLLAILAVLAALGCLSPGRPVLAQQAPSVTASQVENRFPEGIIFRVSAQSDSPIQRVRLRYTILPEGTTANAEAQFQPGATISATFTLEGNNPPRIYLPPGTIIEYRWQITDADGDTTTTETATFFYDDIRFQWKSLEEGGVTAYYYSGSDSQARAMLAVAQETLATMSDLLGTKVDFPVKVWIYQSVGDMRPALARRSSTFEESVITAGVRVASDTVLVLGNAALDTLRHELTHVVTAVAGEGPFGSLPAWLDEGTAVYSQSTPGGYGEAVRRAVTRGNLLPVRSITSPPGDPARVDLFYGQSWSLVSYLMETYGPEKFAQLFAEIKRGRGIDGALMAVYGFDQDGLEDEWRASLGLTPAPKPSPTSTPRPISTGSAPSAGGDGGAGGTSLGVILGIVLGVAALAGVVGLGGIALARRMR